MAGAALVPWHRKLFDFLHLSDPLLGNRRRHQRHPASEKVTLSWKTPSPGAMTAEVNNVSIDGMQVELPKPIQARQLVRISGENREHVGIVVYCEKRGPKFLAGIQLLDRDDPARILLGS